MTAPAPGSERKVWDVSTGRLLGTFHSPYTVAESLMRAAELAGMQPPRLPGNPPKHKVVGQLSDGTVLRVEHIEAAMGELYFAEYTDGHGVLEAFNETQGEHGRRQNEIIAIAKRLYAEGSS